MNGFTLCPSSSSIDEIDSDIKFFIYLWTILLGFYTLTYIARLGFYVYRSIVEKLDCIHRCVSPLSFLFLLKRRETSFHFLKKIKHQKNPETNSLNKQKVGCNWIERDECIPTSRLRKVDQTFTVDMLGYYWLLLFVTDFVSRIPYSYSDRFDIMMYAL